MLPESHNLAKWIGGEGINFFFLLSEKKIYLSLFISQNYLLRIPDHLDV